ncbi:SDR family NAD(P)-dependent oxidoreductase [Collinsella sp. zg1085]|uniref:SDR family NAD(P)-dependent oxidoreductase n=1 Tax=Collinsella sp. zg1085 TaxID=2844380 RepID=UPI001C0DDD59|nr:SDR family NAD(P)-dependent oxidoreductase [Collinsella sp. zg1085]QWT17524.1 SDR family NAD(P)-dependent oxidoreductase [Collinsella sp. zg1085]
MNKKIVVIGAGPGLGNAIARRFGREDYEVVLLARNEMSLATYQQELEALGIKVSTYATDVTDIDAFDKTIEAIQADMGDPDVIVYNVGITSPDEEPLTAKDVMRHLATDVVGAYETIDKFATNGLAAKNGSIILTGGIFAENPYPGYVALSMGKAALQNLALEKNQELADKGIFVGMVMVCGVIGGDEHFAPDNIADLYWDFNAKRNSYEVKFV